MFINKVFARVSWIQKSQRSSLLLTSIVHSWLLLTLKNVVPRGEFWTPWAHDPQIARTQVLAGSAQPALVGVIHNIWPGFVDQVVDKWMNEWKEWMNEWKEWMNEWMNGSIQSPKRPSRPPQFWAKQKMVTNIARNSSNSTHPLRWGNRDQCSFQGSWQFSFTSGYPLIASTN